MTRAAFGALGPLVGTTLGTTGVRVITADDVEQFAELTGDRQWIHVDRERAAAGPYGGQLVHGYLTLALLRSFVAELVDTDGYTTLNYGLDRVRFPRPLVAGRAIRDSIAIESVDQRADGQLVRLSHSVAAGPDVVCSAITVTLVLEGQR